MAPDGSTPPRGPIARPRRSNLTLETSIQNDATVVNDPASLPPEVKDDGDLEARSE
jgi:hypothetical protein